MSILQIRWKDNKGRRATSFFDTKDSECCEILDVTICSKENLDKLADLWLPSIHSKKKRRKDNAQ